LVACQRRLPSVSGRRAHRGVCRARRTGECLKASAVAAVTTTVVELPYGTVAAPPWPRCRASNAAATAVAEWTDAAAAEIDEAAALPYSPVAAYAAKCPIPSWSVPKGVASLPPRDLGSGGGYVCNIDTLGGGSGRDFGQSAE
jgi:hypothetical protein